MALWAQMIYGEIRKEAQEIMEIPQRAKPYGPEGPQSQR